MSDKEEISLYDYLLETLDMKYVAQIFEEGQKLGKFPRDRKQNIEYDYQGNRYIISRIPGALLMAQARQRALIQKKQQEEYYNKGIRK